MRQFLVGIILEIIDFLAVQCQAVHNSFDFPSVEISMILIFAELHFPPIAKIGHVAFAIQVAVIKGDFLDIIWAFIFDHQNFRP